MLIDSEGKISLKINVVDILALLLIVTLGFAACARISAKKRFKTETALVEYKIKAKTVRTCTLNALRDSLLLFDQKSHENLGEIVSVESEPAKTAAETSRGTLVMAELPGRFDVTVSARLWCKVKGKTFETQDGKTIAAGEKVLIRTKFVSTAGEIISARAVE
jgi:hypothetical protein